MSKVKSYAVIGLGGFGSSVARTLAQEGMEVLVMDIHKEKINALAPEVTYALQMDVTNEIAMKNIGLEHMDAAIIAIGENLEVSVMATIICKEIGVPLVIAKAETNLQKTILDRVGADQVILPEKESGYRLAKNIVGNFMDYFSLSGRMSIVEMPVKKEWIGRNLRELKLRSTYGINIISIQNEDGGDPDSFPNPDQIIREGDIITAAGRPDDIENLR